MDYIYLDENNRLLFQDDIIKKTNLSYEEIQELIKSKEGIKYIIKLLSNNIEENPECSYHPFKGLLNLIRFVKDDEIINNYIYNNDYIYNRIIDDQRNYYNYITSIICIIQSDELKMKVLKKYKKIFITEHYKYGKMPYDTQEYIKIIFSFNSPEFIKEVLKDETTSFILNYVPLERQFEIIDEITNKQTDNEKRKCIIPEVIKFIEPCHRGKPILSIESDSIKKECLNDSDILNIIREQDSWMGIKYHTYAHICASYKENNNKEEVIEEGLNKDFLDGEDLAIIISSIKGDAKKTEYRKDERIKKKLNKDEEAAIIESYNEENADKTKYDYIYDKIINEVKMLKSVGLSDEEIKSLYQDSLTMILCSMNDPIKIECIYDEQIQKLLSFSDICKVVISSEDDNAKFKFIKENINELAERSNYLLRELVLTMKMKYKKQCLEDADIVSVLKTNKEKNEGGLEIIDIVGSNYSYCKKEYPYKGKEKFEKIPLEQLQKELEEEDLFKDEFLRKEYQNLSEYKLYCITKSFNNQELMLKWIIYFAEKNIMDFNSIYNIIRIIDTNEYRIQYDKKGIKPISYTRK